MSSRSVAATQVPFWQRQFAPKASLVQIVFDVAAGILLPILCLVADPIVFRARSFGSPLLGNYALLAYFAIGMAFLALALWLLCHRPASVFAGLLGAGAFFALLLGVVLLPFSMLGLFAAGLGLLGLSPSSPHSFSGGTL